MSGLRYFLTYSGVKLPLRLVSVLEESELGHRNTYIRAHYDADERLIKCEKLVYGEVELTHRYRYHSNGILRWAEILIDDERSVLEFDADGLPLQNGD
jgi:hypothetical protein